MHTAALAELGPGGRVVLRGDRGRARGASTTASGRCPARASWARTSPSRTSSRRSRSPTRRRRPRATIGAANTLSFADGRIAAENTDATGFLDALPGAARRQAGAGPGRRRVGPRRRLGAGRRAAPRCAIWNRTRREGRDAWPPSSAPKRWAPEPRVLGRRLATSTWSSTPPPWAWGRRPSVPPTSRACPSMPIPSARDTNWWTWPTGRSRRSSRSAAKARGATVVDGLEVLVRQGAASLRIWTGLEPPIETMRRAARSG